MSEPGVKITGLPVATSIATTDLVPVVKDPAGTPVTNKITWLNLLKSIALGSLDAAGAVDPADLLLLSQSGTPKKLTLGGLITAFQSVFFDSNTVTYYKGGARIDVATVSSNTTLDTGGVKHHLVLVDTTGGAVTLTLPAYAQGRAILVRRIAGSNSVTVQRASSDTILDTANASQTSIPYSDNATHSLVGSTTSATWVEL